MGRRLFSREFKLEAVRLVKERGVSIMQASRDLDVGENVLRRWIKEFSSEHEQAFPGQGQVRPEQQEIDRLRREVAKLKAERDILKKLGRQSWLAGFLFEFGQVGARVAAEPGAQGACMAALVEALA